MSGREFRVLSNKVETSYSPFEEEKKKIRRVLSCDSHKTRSTNWVKDDDMLVGKRLRYLRKTKPRQSRGIVECFIELYNLRIIFRLIRLDDQIVV